MKAAHPLCMLPGATEAVSQELQHLGAKAPGRSPGVRPPVGLKLGANLELGMVAFSLLSAPLMPCSCGNNHARW